MSNYHLEMVKDEQIISQSDGSFKARQHLHYKTSGDSTNNKILKHKEKMYEKISRRSQGSWLHNPQSNLIGAEWKGHHSTNHLVALLRQAFPQVYYHYQPHMMDQVAPIEIWLIRLIGHCCWGPLTTLVIHKHKQYNVLLELKANTITDVTAPDFYHCPEEK